MNDLNQCNFIGRLANDPSEYVSPAGEKSANFRIAVCFRAKDQDGVEWVTVRAQNDLAQICLKQLRKGMQIFASGSLRTRKGIDKKTLEHKYYPEILLGRFQLLGEDKRPSLDINYPFLEPRN